MSAQPASLKSVAEAIDFLYELRLFGTKLGLENPLRLASYFGSPQDSLNFIHVAGTNGKGSVCAMLESIYRSAGYRVGLFTSPHLIQFGERIQVNRELISDDCLLALVNQIRDALRSFPKDQHPTFFEVVVVMALLHFRNQGCEMVIWETGMGGRLDATNIVPPQLSVITNVALDHQKWLGDTIVEIAAEKAGIIKPLIPSIHGVMDCDAQQVIRARAAEVESPLIGIKREDIEPCVGAFEVNLVGEHQRQNAALALQSVSLLNRVFPVSEGAMRQGLASVDWPGRLQVIERGRQVILLDGAHNEPSIAALCRYLDRLKPAQPVAILMGVLEDKGIERWLTRLLPFASQFYLTPVASGRTLTPEALKEAIKNLDADLPVSCFENGKEALEAAMNEEAFLVVCGSIYLVGEILGYLNDRNLPSEQMGLNDWDDDPSQSKP